MDALCRPTRPLRRDGRDDKGDGHDSYQLGEQYGWRSVWNQVFCGRTALKAAIAKAKKSTDLTKGEATHVLGGKSQAEACARHHSFGAQASAVLVGAFESKDCGLWFRLCGHRGRNRRC
jgi:hypothetical protein